MQALNRITENEFRDADTDRFAANEAAVRDLIQRYKICWEVWPEWAGSNSHLEKKGFDLELLGTHAEGTDHVSPGCDACVEVYNALRRVAEDIVPQKLNLPTMCEIEPFEPALRYAAIRKNRPEVLLEMKITHHSGLGPTDDCEKHCVQLMQNRLDALGAYRGRWAPDPDYPAPSTKEDCGHGKSRQRDAHVASLESQGWESHLASGNFDRGGGAMETNQQPGGLPHNRVGAGQQ